MPTKRQLESEAKSAKTSSSSAKTKVTAKNLSFDLSRGETKSHSSKNGNNGNKKGTGSRVTVKYDVGFKNALYVRGRGANLSWEKGVPLKNVRADEWVWEPETPFSQCEFKILINDAYYESGENHHLNNGMKIQYTPHFTS